MPNTTKPKPWNANTVKQSLAKVNERLDSLEAKLSVSEKGTTTATVPNKRPTIKLYTDGSGTPGGPAGWAFVLTSEDEKQELIQSSGAIRAGTSNIAEMLGVIRGLEHCLTEYPDARILVHSDSAYVINAWKDDWFSGWEKRNWKNSRGRPVANKEYWVAMRAAADKLNVEWVHVRGHTGLRYNELCDRLAGEARREEIKNVMDNI